MTTQATDNLPDDLHRAKTEPVESKLSTTQTTKLEKLLNSTWAYGVDWTEFRDKSDTDHEVATYAAKIKDEMKAKLKTEIEHLIQSEASRIALEARKDELNQAGHYIQKLSDNDVDGMLDVIDIPPLFEKYHKDRVASLTAPEGGTQHD